MSQVSLTPFTPAQSPAAPLGADLHAAPAVPSESMSTALEQFWFVVSKYRFAVAAIVLGILALSIVYSFAVTPQYRAYTSFEIDQENSTATAFVDLSQASAAMDTYLETQYQILDSHRVADDVIQQLQLYNLPEFNGNLRAPGQLTPAEANDPRVRDMVEANFLRHLSIEPVRRSMLVGASFLDRDPVLATHVMQVLGQVYIQQNLDKHLDESRAASSWLADQLVGLKGKLEQSEEQLLGYSQGHGILYVDSSNTLALSQLKAIEEELSTATNDRAAKQAAYEAAVRDPGASSSVLVNNPTIQNLTLKVADLSAQAAQQSAVFGTNYPAVRQLQDELNAARAALEQERSRVLGALQSDYLASAEHEHMLQTEEQQQLKQVNQLAQDSVQYTILSREVDTNRQLYDNLLQRLKEAAVSSQVTDSNIRVVDAPEVPARPASPNRPLYALLGLLFGLLGGVGYALLRDALDNSIKAAAEVETSTGRRLLGMVPQMDLNAVGISLAAGLPAGEGAALARSGGYLAQISKFISDTRNSAGEAYRALRMMLGVADDITVVAFTSAEPGDGKTFTSVNLAIVLAQAGERVLLLDCDLRRPTLSKLLRAGRGLGLSSHLAGECSLDEALQQTGIPNLSLLPAGPIPANPDLLIGSTAMAELIQNLRRTYRYIIMDTSPVLLVTETQALARCADAVLLVVRHNATSRHAVTRAAKLLSYYVQERFIGVLLNGFDTKSGSYSSYYGYGYGYGYGAKPEESES